MNKSDKILIVDDMMMARSLLKRTLKEMGFENVVEATNGLKAYELLKTPGHDVKLMILDWMMPEMTGEQLLRKLKEDGIAQDVPVVMVSAETESANLMEATKLGVKSYIQKPINKAIIEERLKKFLES
jgi:two-component system chemotaxis response regulator CheY